ncbi:MAG TPA: FAD-linked oxidase C-terminal domain-containing protein [Acidimicrobiales bacterium]|nr:FAD-linked oxidase C-terminal domain-containing protein [Acidimicrobiales bacterium]
MPAGMPVAVCFPATTKEVAAVVGVAVAHRVPVVTRGAGSGLAGAANAVEGCIVLSTTRMNAILAIDDVDQQAIVQPGVLNGALKAAARVQGMDYPPDPASFEFSTIGGNIATNAGGLCCVKYGVTRDYVLGLEVVLADGNILRTGRRTSKGVAGYDLTSLIVGSEGTLGVVTEATLRLRASTAHAPSTAVASFASLEAAGVAVVSIMRSGVMPSLLELMDQTTIRAVESWQRMELDTDAAALLLVQSDQRGAEAAADIEVVTKLCAAAGADNVIGTSDPEEGLMLLAARRFAYPALERLGATLLDDVAVPRRRIPELLTGINGISRANDVTIGTFGHAGDGNFHPTVVYGHDDAVRRASALASFDSIVRLALSLGGTVSGEHGIGLLKRRHLALELDGPAVTVHHAIKRALDPLGIFNPGKALPATAGESAS